jgi:hypothetical protein
MWGEISLLHHPFWRRHRIHVESRFHGWTRRAGKALKQALTNETFLQVIRVLALLALAGLILGVLCLPVAASSTLPASVL